MRLVVLLLPVLFSLAHCLTQRRCDECNTAVDLLMQIDHSSHAPHIGECSTLGEEEGEGARGVRGAREACARLFMASTRATDLLVAMPDQACIHTGFCAMDGVTDEDTLVAEEDTLVAEEPAVKTLQDDEEDERALGEAERSVAVAPSAPEAHVTGDPADFEHPVDAEGAQAAPIAGDAEAADGDEEGEDEDDDDDDNSISDETAEKLQALYDAHKAEPGMQEAAALIANDVLLAVDGEEEVKQQIEEQQEQQSGADDEEEDDDDEKEAVEADGPNDPATNDAVLAEDKDKEAQEVASDGDVLAEDKDEDEDEDEDEEDEDNDEIDADDVANAAEKLASILEAKADKAEAKDADVLLAEDASADMAEGSPVAALFPDLDAYNAHRAAKDQQARAEEADEEDESTKDLPVDMLYQKFADDVDAELQTVTKPEEPIMDFSKSSF
jgi:hypothetical protein